MLHYDRLLQTTFADMPAMMEGGGDDFVFTLHNPEWEEGKICVTYREGELTLSFATMQQDYTGCFGEMIAFIDELLRDESMVFTFYSHGKEALGGCRGTDEIDIDHSLRTFVKSLCEGDRTLYAELQNMIKEGECYCVLRGFYKARNRTMLLS